MKIKISLIGAVLSLSLLSGGVTIASESDSFIGNWEGNMKTVGIGTSKSSSLIIYDKYEGELSINNDGMPFKAKKSGNRISFNLNKRKVQGCYNWRFGCKATLSEDKKVMNLICNGYNCKGLREEMKGVFNKR